MLNELLNLLNLLFMLWVIPLVALFLVLSPFLLYAFLVKKFKIKRFTASSDVKDFEEISGRVKDVVEKEIKGKSFKG